MNIKKLHEIVSILMKYDQEESVEAAHDEIFFSIPEDLTEEDRQALEKLHVHENSYDGFSAYV